MAISFIYIFDSHFLHRFRTLIFICVSAQFPILLPVYSFSWVSEFQREYSQKKTKRKKWKEWTQKAITIKYKIFKRRTEWWKKAINNNNRISHSKRESTKIRKYNKQIYIAHSYNIKRKKNSTLEFGVWQIFYHFHVNCILFPSFCWLLPVYNISLCVNFSMNGSIESSISIQFQFNVETCSIMLAKRFSQKIFWYLFFFVCFFFVVENICVCWCVESTLPFLGVNSSLRQTRMRSVNIIAAWKRYYLFDKEKNEEKYQIRIVSNHNRPGSLHDKRSVFFFILVCVPPHFN